MSRVELQDYEKFVASTISPASSDVNSLELELMSYFPIQNNLM